MKELITWIIISGLLFSGFVITIGIGLVKQNKKLVIISVAVFFLCCITSGVTIYKFVTKSYVKISGYLKPRSGTEIYNALFGKPEKTACLDIIEFQDQVIPKIDYAIWLHFKTCPAELKRIVSLKAFHVKKTSIKDISIQKPGEGSHWFKPELLGDTVLVYRYKKDSAGGEQTLYSNLAETEVYCMDASE